MQSLEQYNDDVQYVSEVWNGYHKKVAAMKKIHSE
jgi:hypothetical protein